MSMHKIPLTQIEEDGLRSHGLDIGTPSQLSDVFRLGVAWCKQQQKTLSKKTPYKDHYIVECEDGTFDITDINGELVDGEFATSDDCKCYLDDYD